MGCGTSSVGAKDFSQPLPSSAPVLLNARSRTERNVELQYNAAMSSSKRKMELQRNMMNHTAIQNWASMKGSKTSHSLLFQEHQDLLKQAGAEYHDSQMSFTSKDILVVVDMQNDFLPVEDSPDGGRLPVPEGASAAGVIVDLIAKAAKAGATIIATRDYHPKNHCSFHTNQGSFPVHCVQGSKGSQFFPPIEKALSRARDEHSADVRVVFKGFMSDVDSFGVVKYDEEGFNERQLGRAPTPDRYGISASTDIFGCCALDWTGSFCLECSSIAEDINAPPDVMYADGCQSLSEELIKLHAERLFAVGLAMDISVLDTAINAASLNIASDGIFMPVDASRALHSPALGLFGSGFLTDPSHIVSKTKNAGVKLCHAQRSMLSDQLATVMSSGQHIPIGNPISNPIKKSHKTEID